MPDFGIATTITDYTLRPTEIGPWAEAEGYDSIWFGEHSHIPTSRKSQRRTTGEVSEMFKQFYDPYITLMAVAACTQTLKLGTSISLVTERHPISFAKTISTLDQLSGGRVIIGVGAGWNAEEMADYGIAFTDRWKYVRECVSAMREIWNNDVAEYHGDLVSFEPMWSWPKPRQPGGPPILLGALSDYVPKRVAEYCDGWIPVDQGETTQRLAVSVVEEWERSGRDPAKLKMTVILNGVLTDKDYQATEDSVVERIAELQRLGFTRMLFSLPCAEPKKQREDLDVFCRMKAAAT